MIDQKKDFYIEKEINKITDFFHTNFHVEISNKNEKIKNVIKSTNFDNLKNMENKNSFFEKSEFSDFFRSGKKKQWENKLNQNQINLILNNYMENNLVIIIIMTYFQL